MTDSDTPAVCLHHFEDLIEVFMTCGYDSARIIHCKRCKSHLTAEFFSHDDRRSYPRAVYDRAWFDSPHGFPWGSEKAESLPEEKWPWDINPPPATLDPF